MCWEHWAHSGPKVDEQGNNFRQNEFGVGIFRLSERDMPFSPGFRMWQDADSLAVEPPSLSDVEHDL